MVVPKSCAESACNNLNRLLPTLDMFAATLANTAINMDTTLQDCFDDSQQFANYRMPHAGIGHADEWRANLYTALADKVEQRLALLNELPRRKRAGYRSAKTGDCFPKVATT